ncbi:BTB/POZ protein [Thamnidium elegans]|nr:BTB/POZ protein [Thamnidium elegans]
MAYDSIVQINVGGTMYTTTVQTLQKSFYLAKLLKSSRELYVDRDGPLFRFVLYYLRTNMMYDIGKTNLEFLLEEAKYYDILGLQETIEGLLAKYKNVNYPFNYSIRPNDFT